MIKITGGNRRGALVIYDGLGSLCNLFPHETVLFGEYMHGKRNTKRKWKAGHLRGISGRDTSAPGEGRKTRKEGERGMSMFVRDKWSKIVRHLSVYNIRGSGGRNFACFISHNPRVTYWCLFRPFNKLFQ